MKLVQQLQGQSNYIVFFLFTGWAATNTKMSEGEFFTM